MEKAGIVGGVRRISSCAPTVYGRVPRRMHTRCAVQSVHLETRVIAEHDLPRCVQTVFHCFLPGIGLKGNAVLHHPGQKMKTRHALDRYTQRSTRPGKVAEFPGVGSSNEHVRHEW